jgi:hypothetical protein
MSQDHIKHTVNSISQASEYKHFMTDYLVDQILIILFNILKLINNHSLKYLKITFMR